MTTSVKLTLEEGPREGAIRADLAWQLFFESKPSIPEGHGRNLLPFTNWLWDELSKKAGNLNKNSPRELSLTIPALSQQALDYLVRIASFWADDIRLKKGGNVSDNLWKKPVVNVLNDEMIDGAERSLSYKEESWLERYFMPLLGPGRAFFRVEIIPTGESAARFHSHSEVDEYYLILEGTGTLRYNDKETLVTKGDLIGKPTGPDATSQIIADKGEPLRILDMEVWHGRPYVSKDLVLNPDFNEIIMRGPGWGALFPADALMTSEDFRKHYDEGYKRTRDGGWVPSKARGHSKVRERR
jgi:uncharacterized cupin superfamily protein